MFNLRVSAVVAVASLLLIYPFPWTRFSSENAVSWSVPFTTPLPGWHHPESQSPSLVSPSHDGQGRSKDWNIHRHLGGNGPWISNADATNDGIRPPPGCEIEQVHMLSRHAERYPTVKAGARLLRLLARLHSPNVTLSGDLAFANDWKFFSSEPQADFDQLTRSGPYAGTLAAFSTGVRIRTRYAYLLNRHLKQGKVLNLWAGDSQRVIETAQHFAAGFLGLDWESRASLHVIPETTEMGGDTLTPGKSCLGNIYDLEHGREGGYAALATFTDATFTQTAERLEKFIATNRSENFKLSTVEVYAMQELCGFEILARGSSPWCDVFTRDEWDRFAYARDVLHFYRAGPGGKYSLAMGGLYLNATAELMVQGPKAGPLFFSFVHDGDIVPVLSALHILHDGEILPTTHVKPDRKWKTSRITPMGGRIIFERIRCRNRVSSNDADDVFVRININDGVVPVPGCDSGSGLCPLAQFVARLRKHQEDAGDFRKVCGMGEDLPERITFLHQ